MFVFQVNTQKQFERQQESTKIFTGEDAQRLLKSIAPACELVLLKIQGV